MRTSSGKQKVRRLQQYVAKAIQDMFGLHTRDVQSRSMGASGTDVALSEVAFKEFPWAVECKNTERLDLWGSWEQAKANADQGSPVLIVKRNRSDTLAIVDFHKFMEMTCKKT